MNKQEIRSWALVSALMQRGWRLVELNAAGPSTWWLHPPAIVGSSFQARPVSRLAWLCLNNRRRLKDVARTDRFIEWGLASDHQQPAGELAPLGDVA